MMFESRRRLTFASRFVERSDQMVKLIRGLRRTPLKLKRCLRTSKIVSPDRCCYRDEVTCDQPVDDKKDEKGDGERLYRLTDHDDQRGLEQPAINVVVRGFDRENADQLISAANRIENFEFVPCRWIGLVGTGGHREGGGSIGSLAHLDEAYIRQAKNPADLQLKLALVQSPEPFAETLPIAAIDLGHPLIDCSDTAAVVEVELRQCQGQRDHRAEEKDSDEKAPPDAAEQRAPSRRAARQRR